MPIITLQRRQTEVGRIRIGEKVKTSNGKSRPAKLDKFRITTASQRLIDEVARLYGGEVREWAGSPSGTQWEVYTEARRLPVVVPPQNFLTQWYEMWTGGGCKRRCDGQTETRTGQPCLCPADLYERGDLAKEGKACKATTRLNIMLAEVPSIGVWRLESHGNNAAIEMPGVAEVLAQTGGYVEGVLELQQRKQVVEIRGKVETRQFIVPYLDVHQAPREVVALSAGPSAHRQAIGAAGEQPAAIEATAASEPVDWMARIDAIATEADGKALWHELANSGELTDELKAAMKARAGQLKAATAPPAEPEPETVDAEIVDDDPRDADTLWQQIVAAAGERGWRTSELDQRFQRAVGVAMPDATAAQLRQFLTGLDNGGQ